jgi:hypothetical protein
MYMGMGKNYFRILTYFTGAAFNILVYVYQDYRY